MGRPGWVVTVRSPDATSRTWRFDAGEVRVGRDASCLIRLDAPEVSGVHLRLLLGEGSVTAVDAESRHGARLHDRPLPPGTPVALPPGAEIDFAGHRLRVDPETPGGWTTDSRATADRLALVRAAVAGVAARAPGEPPTPAGSTPPTAPEPPDRVYILALCLAALGALLALAALVRAFIH
jgi:hypothetical protein